MRRWLNSIKAWHVQRQQNSLARWEQVRAKGRGRFVLSLALSWAVTMTAFRDVYDHLFSGGGNVSSLRWNLALYFFTGIFIGFVSWSGQEGKYKDALLNRRVSIDNS